MSADNPRCTYAAELLDGFAEVEATWQVMPEGAVTLADLESYRPPIDMWNIDSAAKAARSVVANCTACDDNGVVVNPSEKCRLQRLIKD